jgi:hypothetical protein
MFLHIASYSYRLGLEEDVIAFYIYRFEHRRQALSFLEGKKHLIGEIKLT